MLKITAGPNQPFVTQIGIPVQELYVRIKRISAADNGIAQIGISYSVTPSLNEAAPHLNFQLQNGPNNFSYRFTGEVTLEGFGFAQAEQVMEQKLREAFPASTIVGV